MNYRAKPSELSQFSPPSVITKYSILKNKWWLELFRLSRAFRLLFNYDPFQWEAFDL